MDDKNNIVISSYKIETKTGLLVKYLKNTKKTLWEKFSYQFPNGIKRTSFMTFLQGKQYIYQENLGGLCSICSRYGYEIFADMKQFVEKNIQDNNLQISNLQFIYLCNHKAYLFISIYFIVNKLFLSLPRKTISKNLNICVVTLKSLMNKNLKLLQMGLFLIMLASATVFHMLLAFVQNHMIMNVLNVDNSLKFFAN